MQWPDGAGTVPHLTHTLGTLRVSVESLSREGAARGLVRPPLSRPARLSLAEPASSTSVLFAPRLCAVRFVHRLA